MDGDYFTGGSVSWDKNRKAYRGTVSYYEGGKRKQKAKLFREAGKSKKMAQELCDAWKADLNSKARRVPPEELVKPKTLKTVGERVEEYMRYLEELVSRGDMELSTFTARQSTARLYILSCDIASKRYEGLTRDDIVAWEDYLHSERGIANSTIGIPHSLLKRIYNHDLERGQIDASPFQFLKAPKAEKRYVNAATPESFRRLNEALSLRWKREPGSSDVLCYYLAIYTGMRGQEICGLRWADIHEPQGVIEVRRAVARNDGKPYIKGPKTPESERIIPIIPALYPLLETRRQFVCLQEGVQEVDESWYVVGEADKFRSPQNVASHFARFCRNNNITGSEGRYLTLHGLRDTFATIAVQGKAIDIKSLSALLGHTNTQMTLSRYVGIGDEGIRREGMAQIGKAFERILASDV